jgi:predicted PhzF superfamily epimerase YddE/YHI9
MLWETGVLPPEETARFYTRSGLLTAAQVDGWIELDFPALPPSPVPAPNGLAEALGAAPRWVGGNGMDLLVELGSEAEVRGLASDLRALAAAAEVRGVIVTAPGAGSGQTHYDFVSRFFAPRAGVDEDPVTGSAHCCLGPFWGERLGKTEMLAFQASPRGGEVRVRLAGPRVRLGGQAVTVLRGELLAAARSAP